MKLDLVKFEYCEMNMDDMSDGVTEIVQWIPFISQANREVSLRIKEIRLILEDIQLDVGKYEKR